MWEIGGAGSDGLVHSSGRLEGRASCSRHPPPIEEEKYLDASATLVHFGSDPRHSVTRKQVKKAAAHPYRIILMVAKISSW